MNNDSIVDQGYWNLKYEKKKLGIVPKRHPIRKLIIRYIPQSNGYTNCIEIGAYPCGYLGIFGELGYELNGIDMTDKIESIELKKWIIENKWNYNIFKKINFLNFDTKDKYNIVYSIGFIEHFENWNEILLKHTELLKKDGYLLIVTPNFSGILQKAIHYYFDKENYKRHIIESMNPKKWTEILGKNYQVIFMGYFGGFFFWVDKQKGNIFKKIITMCIRILGIVLTKLSIPIPNSKIYSPFCGLIVKKTL
jgi:2-polyprenyl-3-methyl-5-hydroxy-6-metoxy-1,4-benzoquinol methylase